MPSLRREKGVAWILVGLAVLFLACGVVRMVTVERGATAITLPVALLASDLLIAATLVSRWQLVRPIAQGLAIFGTLVHLLVLMRHGPLWTRACAGLLVVAHVEALLLLFRMTIRERDEIDRADPVAGQGPAAEEPEAGSPEAGSPEVQEPPPTGVDVAPEGGEGVSSETLGGEHDTGSAVVVPAQRVATVPAAEAPVAEQEEPVLPVRSETESEEPEQPGEPVDAGNRASDEGGQASENEERAS